MNESAPNLSQENQEKKFYTIDDFDAAFLEREETLGEEYRIDTKSEGWSEKIPTAYKEAWADIMNETDPDEIPKIIKRFENANVVDGESRDLYRVRAFLANIGQIRIGDLYDLEDLL